MSQVQIDIDNLSPYFFVLEDENGEPFALENNMTLGRHLDNELIIAGEDVADFHARIEIGQRTVQVVPMPGCVVHVGDAVVKERHGLMPGDRMLIGLHRVRFGSVGGEPACSWALFPPKGDQRIAIEDELQVGRSKSCALQLGEGHVSRHHAIVRACPDGVWLKDLGSSNGTFVNGDRVTGACRLFHGDVVSFDTQAFQLVGDDPEFTPVMPFEPSLSMPPEHREPVAPMPPPIPTMEVGQIETSELPAVDEPSGEGPVLLGRSRPIAGKRFALSFGKYLIGRSDAADIRVDDESVSIRHAELEVRPDGVFITNLMSTNGTVVNGTAIHTIRLNNGDRVDFGRVALEFVDAGTASPGDESLLERRRWTWVAAAGGVVAVAALGWWLI